MFCNKCGRELTTNDIFCPSCGNKQEMQQGGAQPPPVSNPSPYTYQYQQQNQNPGYSQGPILNNNKSGFLKNPVYTLLAYIASLAILLFIALAMKDVVGIGLSVILIGISVVSVFMPLRKGGNLQQAAKICLGCAAATMIIGIFALFSGGGLIGVLDIIASALGFLAYNNLPKH